MSVMGISDPSPSRPYFKAVLSSCLANLGLEETLKMLVEECYANAQRQCGSTLGLKLAHGWHSSAAMLERALARASRVAE